MVDQGKVKGFFINAKNADKLGGLVEDIRDAMMEYQVNIHELSTSGTRLTLAQDFVATRHLRQELSAHRESHPATFRSRGVTAR